MKSSHLMLGEKYRIRYRPFTQSGNINYGIPLQDGYGRLVGLYTVRGYNHTFELDDGTEVWATPNSIFPLNPEKPKNSIVSDIIGEDSADSVTLKSIVAFLSGLEISSEIHSDGILISGSGVVNFKNLIMKMYSDILDV